MRSSCLLVCALLIGSLSSTAVHAQFGGGEDDPDKKLAVIQLDVWMVTLSPEAGDETMDSARAPLDDRNAVVERIRKMEKEDAIIRSHYFMATTLEGREVIVQLGSREPRVQALNITQSGTSQSIVYEDVGTLFTGTAQLDSKSRVVLEMQLESSYLEESETAIHIPKEGEPVNAPQVAQQTFHSTLACPSGGAIVAMSYDGQANSEQSITVIYLTAEVK